MAQTDKKKFENAAFQYKKESDEGDKTAQKQPLVSVIMPCYNREKYVVDAIESILNQTYTNFEFIIIDDCSQDNTFKIVQEYAKIDKRIIALRNDQNYCYVHSLNEGLKMAKGKYIARMDDDDISLPQRFEKQVAYLEEHDDITVLGSYIKVFDKEQDNKFSFVDEHDSDLLSLLTNFMSPLCHPSVMMRKDFFDTYNLHYSREYEFAEDYYLWTQILDYGGKIANLPEVLFLYRSHKEKVSEGGKTILTQQQLSRKIRTQRLIRFFDEKEVQQILDSTLVYPFVVNKSKWLHEVFCKMQRRDTKGLHSIKAYESAITKYCGVKSTLNIFFNADNGYAEQLCVAMASILKNSSPLDDFNFYILDNGLSEHSKFQIIQLKDIKTFEIEFIKIDEKQIEHLQTSQYCHYISKTTYCRYFISALKPELERCLYLDCDIIVEDSLNLLYNMNFDGCYVCAVDQMWDDGRYYWKDNFLGNRYFNAGVFLVNNALWVRDEIDKKLMFNSQILMLQNRFTFQDQDALNYTFSGKVKIINPKYNVELAAFLRTHYHTYTPDEVLFAQQFPVIIHYTGSKKPWERDCPHPLWERYWEYIQFTPYKEKYYTEYPHILQINASGLRGARQRVQKQLSYRLGSTLLEAKDFIKLICLPFSLIKTLREYALDQRAYKVMIDLYPHLKLQSLEEYMDYEEAKKAKQHLSYRLGNALIKHPFTFVFRIKGIYKEFKKCKR